MTDKEKIINEIKLRLQNNESILDEGINNIPNLNGRIEEEKSLLAFINSLPEEPVSEDLDAEIQYLHERYPEVSFAKLTRIVVRATRWQKEQMMKDAIDADVLLDYYDSEDREVDVVMADNIFADEHGIKEDDKVKIIIVKEK